VYSIIRKYETIVKKNFSDGGYEKHERQRWEMKEKGRRKIMEKAK
jgi:hypothetical protein